MTKSMEVVMGLRFSLFITACVFGFGLSGCATTDVPKERAEVRNMCNEALAMLYKEKPEVRAEVAKSAGYGCFASVGATFFFGGAGGKGLVHNNATKKDTYMNMAQASAGIEVGAKDYREVLLFKDRQTLEQFVESGWDASVGGGAVAQVKGKGGEVGAGAGTAGIEIYPMTTTGLAAGASLAGRKYWKDKDLN
jgi:lipid-binding SYLF domain-containing protein